MLQNKNKIWLWLIIAISVFLYFVANFQRLVIPGSVFDILEQEMSVTAPYIAAFGTIFMFVYAISQLIIGVLVDKYGGIRVMAVGAILLALGCIIFPLTSDLNLMYFSRALIGIGSGSFYLSLIREFKNIFSENTYGIAISVMLFIGYAGGVFAGAPFVVAMKYLPWREILLILAFVIAILTVLYMISLPRFVLPAINKSVKLRILPFRLVLHKKHNRNLFSFACCNFGISYVIQTIIGKKFLEDFCQCSSARAALIVSTMAIVAACFNVINASFCKLCHNHRVIFLKSASVVTFLILSIICILILFDVKTMGIGVLFCILAGNASLSSLLVPVLFLSNRKMISVTAVSIMNFSFFMMVAILGTLTGFILHLFDPMRVNGILIYSNNSYLVLFLTFWILSLFEIYKAMKLSNKY